MKTKLMSAVVFIVAVAIIVVLDRISKQWIVTNIFLNDGFPVIKGFFNIVYVRNFGGAFSILQHKKYLFMVMGIAVPVLLIYFLKDKFSRLSYLIAASMIVGGAIGNLIDRFCFGYVIDFLQFGRFPVFNVADSFITVGVTFLAVLMIIDDFSQKKSAQPEEEKGDKDA